MGDAYGRTIFILASRFILKREKPTHPIMTSRKTRRGSIFFYNAVVEVSFSRTERTRVYAGCGYFGRSSGHNW
jgi:hypothetical protein